MQKISYIATDNNLTLILDGKPKQIKLNSKNHRNDLIKSINTFNNSPKSDKDFEVLLKYLEPIKRIQLESDNRFELEDNKLYLKGSDKAIEPGLADKILDFIENGLPIDALVKFWESCLKNPHYIAIKELFTFLEKNNMPITDNGGFLGYKKLNLRGDLTIPEEFLELVIVKNEEVTTINGKKVDTKTAANYLEFLSEINNPTMYDVYSGRIKQKIGEEVKQDFQKFCPEEIRKACGTGLHIGSFDYAFSGNVRVLCEVYPEDVIASDVSNSKLRTSRYKLVSFVDSQKEIKDLLVYLNSPKEDSDSDFDLEFDETNNPFSAGEIVVSLEEKSSLTKGGLYFITDTEEEDVKVVNDDGNEEWFNYTLFNARN